MLLESSGHLVALDCSRTWCVLRNKKPPGPTEAFPPIFLMCSFLVYFPSRLGGLLFVHTHIFLAIMGLRMSKESRV